MKVLVVDDDPTMCRLVSRLASRHPSAEVRQAVDGVAALAAIETDAPDLIFTDMEMPHLGGVGLLEALRASVNHRGIPVVAISSVSEKAMVLRMVDLGIEDYMLKPLDPATAAARFDAILAKVAAKASARDESPTTGSTLLLVDKEPGYGDVVRAAVGGRFEIVDHLPAAAALAWAVTNAPAVAVLCRGLPMPGEEGIAAALREGGKTIVLLLDDSGKTDPIEGFDAVIARSHVPKKLAQALEPLLSRTGTDRSQLATTLATTVRVELAAGCRQSLGILVGMESTEAEGDAALASDATAIEVLLSREGSGESVLMVLLVTPADLGTLAAEAEPDHQDPAALLSALATHAGERVKHSLGHLGWALEAAAPAAVAGPVDAEGAATRVDLVTESGQRVIALLRLQADAPAIASEEEDSPPATESPAEESAEENSP